MKEILELYGFVPTNSLNEYTKDEWVIRLDNNRIEMFEYFSDETGGRYLIGEWDKEHMEAILKEIMPS